MNAATVTALTVKELEPGEFHWIWLDETSSAADESLCYVPRTVSTPYADPSSAWMAGCLAIRRSLMGVAPRTGARPPAGGKPSD
jgi:hypothetical protein